MAKQATADAQCPLRMCDRRLMPSLMTHALMMTAYAQLLRDLLLQCPPYHEGLPRLPIHLGCGENLLAPLRGCSCRAT